MLAYSARLESLRGAKADAEAQWKRLQNGNKKLESKYRNAIEHLDTLEVEMASLGAVILLRAAT